MKHQPPRNEIDRFKGSLRHYHRTAQQEKRTWDEWIDGKPAGSGTSFNWLKIGIIVLALVALVGVIVGLVIELG